MSPPNQQSTPPTRERGQARVRQLTRGAALLATGATVAIGIVVAHDHPGASGVRRGATGAGSSAGTGASTGASTSSGNTDNSGISGNTGNSGSSAPTSSSSTPTVTSGGSAP